LALAASIVLIAGAVVALVVRHGDEEPAAAPTTTVPTTIVLTTAPPTSPPVLAPLHCNDVKIDRYDASGTVHTVVANTDPLSASITNDVAAVCSAGTITSDATLTNTSSATVHVAGAALLLSNGGGASWAVHVWDGFDLAAGATTQLHASYQLPAVPPGEYRIYVMGFDAYAGLQVEGPDAPFCPPDCAPGTTAPPQNCGPADLTAVEGQTEGAMGTEYTPIVLTNGSDRECVLSGPPVSISWVDASGAAHPVELTPSGMAPVHPVTLQPGGTATFNLGIAGECMYATPAKAVPDTLRFTWPDGTISAANRLPMPCPAFINTIDWPTS
jgi:hypothetical protein